ncbi:hypothetical protein lerEdw1_008319 [Lerista edwardsae]|nr:hypothetical protein lerEdw1_008319 [Lerista edwardsae]
MEVEHDLAAFLEVFLFLSTAYAAGMVITFVALSLMKMPQPALLYLAPATLIVSAAVAFYRKEMKKFWNGTTYQVMDTANENAKEQPRRQ